MKHPGGEGVGGLVGGGKRAERACDLANRLPGVGVDDCHADFPCLIAGVDLRVGPVGEAERGGEGGERCVMRGVPRHIRSDNGPEFIAQTLRRWLKQVGVGTLYIEPGSPWENGYAESFHGRLRDEFLAMEIFDGVRDARSLTAAWRAEYNAQRPHSSLGYLTTAGFAAGREARDSTGWPGR